MNRESIRGGRDGLGPRGAALRSLAVVFPDGVRGNDYFRERAPDVVADAENRTLARVFGGPERQRRQRARPRNGFEEVMQPFLDDPFRGTVSRRALRPGETPLAIEIPAAREALARAGLAVADLDLVLCGSFPANEPGLGNGVHIAKALGHRGPAWNFETACSGSLAALQQAAALIRSGQFENVLVVVSCTYSRVSDERDSLAWFLGDGAAAFVMGPCEPGEGFLHGHNVSTVETCGAFRYELDLDPDGAPQIYIRAAEGAGRLLSETATPYLEECCRTVLDAAGVRPSDLAALIVNTPTAWYHEFAARTLGVELHRTVSRYSEIGNIGPVLVPANLFFAAHAGMVQPGDLVLLYSVGSVSTASAVLLRWTDVALGPDVLRADGSKSASPRKREEVCASAP